MSLPQSLCQFRKWHKPDGVGATWQSRIPASGTDPAKPTTPNLMFNIATDLKTRQTVWISTNVLKGRPQLNSHRDDHSGRAMSAAEIDGYPAYEIAGFYTNYQGRNIGGN